MMSALANLSGYDAAHSNLTATQLLDIEDVNHDGVVNNADLQSLLNLLQSGGGSADTVPEPSSGWLVLGCIVCCCSFWGKHFNVNILRPR